MISIRLKRLSRKNNLENPKNLMIIEVQDKG
jgi:hypothetical protein